MQAIKDFYLCTLTPLNFMATTITDSCLFIFITQECIHTRMYVFRFLVDEQMSLSIIKSLCLPN